MIWIYMQHMFLIYYYYLSSVTVSMNCWATFPCWLIALLPSFHRLDPKSLLNMMLFCYVLKTNIGCFLGAESWTCIFGGIRWRYRETVYGKKTLIGQKEFLQIADSKSLILHARWFCKVSNLSLFVFPTSCTGSQLSTAFVNRMVRLRLTGQGCSPLTENLWYVQCVCLFLSKQESKPADLPANSFSCYLLPALPVGWTRDPRVWSRGCRGAALSGPDIPARLLCFGEFFGCQREIQVLSLDWTRKKNVII